MKKESLENQFLLKVRQAALSEYIGSMPKKGEDPDVFAARCWVNAMLECMEREGYYLEERKK